jgi:Arc/MetJ-type ribon-helix-helix transcriptional regulator
MSQQIAVRLPEDELAALDGAVAHGGYKSRAAAVRDGIARIVHEEREREIAESYRRAYTKYPQEREFAEAAAYAMDEILAEREREQR